MTNQELIAEAQKAMEFAYSPYSNFKVGAAIETESGKVYTGCNIENASFGATNCAERTAIFKAVSEGETKFKKIAIVGSQNPCYPCGICRQVMSEFTNSFFPIILLSEDGNILSTTLEDLLPHSFNL